MAKKQGWGSKPQDMMKALHKMKKEEARRKKQIRREQKRIKAEQKKAQRWATKGDKAWGGKPSKEEKTFTRKKSNGKLFGRIFKRESYLTLRAYYYKMDNVNNTVRSLLSELRGAKDARGVQVVVGRYLGEIEKAGGGAVSALVSLFKKKAA